MNLVVSPWIQWFQLHAAVLNPELNGAIRSSTQTLGPLVTLEETGRLEEVGLKPCIN